MRYERKRMHFMATRNWLKCVLELNEEIDSVRERIDAATLNALDTDDLYEELFALKREKMTRQKEMKKLISKVPRYIYRQVLTLRYVEGKTFEQVACELMIPIGVVMNHHGICLPEMQDVLLAEGVIDEAEAEDMYEVLKEEGRLEVPAMKRYLEYRKEHNRWKMGA